MTDRFDQIAELMQKHRAESFTPYFADRVMRRVRGEGLDRDAASYTLYDALRWVFVRAAVACMVLIVAIGILNVVQFGSASSGNLVEALLGLPSDSLADMLTYNLI